MNRVFLGVDLSLTGLGLVAVPDDWDMRWGKLAQATIGSKLESRDDSERIARLHLLACRVVQFAKANAVTDVWIEAYPMGAGRMLPGIHRVAEVGGAVRFALFSELGLCPSESPLSSARKLVLGKLPQKNQKAAVHQALWSYGARFSTLDECDAFVAANWGLHESAMPCLYREAA